MKGVFKLTIGIVFLTLVFSSVGWSQSTADIVLIIDSSGSMDTNDPKDLRKAAANQFIDLAEADVQIGIVDFDSHAVTLASLAFADAAGKSKLKDAVAVIDASGGTNIAAGLQQGFAVLSDSTTFTARKAAVLLTDGEDNDRKALNAYVGNYVAEGWSVYTIGLDAGGSVDRALLGAIAAETPEGEYYSVTLDNIQSVYNKILAKITRKSVLTNLRGFLNQDQEAIRTVAFDAAITQANFSLSWQGSTIELVLVDPSGAEITPDIAARLGVGYQGAPTFAIYTVANPMQGEWQMRMKGTDIPPEGEAYSLVVTGTSDFVTNFLAFEASYSLGETLRIGVDIQQKTGDTASPVLGATTSADIVRPDGRIETLTLFDDGSHNDGAAGDGTYASNYTNMDVLGTYLIRAAAQNGFQRQIEQQIVVGAIDNVFIDGATLLPAAGATLNQIPNLIRAAISGPAGRINSESIVLKLDGALVAHTYDAVNQRVSFQPTHLSRGTHTVSINVNNAIETAWTFTITEARWTMALEKGLNMISVPLMPDEPYTAKTLGELVGATTVIRYDTAKQVYFAYVVTDSTEGFAIAGGKGYIVNIPVAKTVTFTGTAWMNPSVPAAPSFSTEASAWAFVVSGDVRGFNPNARYKLRAKNLRTGTEAATAISDDTAFVKAVWVDLNRNSVVQTGDTLVLTLHADDGTIVAGPLQREVSDMDIHNAHKQVTLRGADVQPHETRLAQNYPNPFNPETWIPYQLSDPTDVAIQIYDSSGHLVRTLNIGLKAAGVYATRSRAIYWDGKNETGERVASGVYFYTLRTPEFSATRRMVILK